VTGLLIYGAVNDAHIRLVTHALQQHENIRCFIYDPWNNVRATYRCGSHKSLDPTIWAQEIVWHNDEPHFPTQRIELKKDVRAIWLRNKRFIDTIETPQDQDKFFSSRENSAFLFGIIPTFNILHFNNITSIHLQRFKILQLDMAEQAGFRVPETLISSDKRTIARFVKEAPTIIKPLHTNFIPPTMDGSDSMIVLMTNRVTHTEIRDTPGKSLAAAPSIYQREILKDHEIRLVACGNSAVGYRIESQRSRLGKLDWRRGQVEPIFQKMEIAGALKKAAVTYLRLAHLQSGVFDIAVDKEGRAWFLECNSEGQWAWLEPYWDGPIARMFAREITHLLQKDPTVQNGKAGVDHARIRNGEDSREQRRAPSIRTPIFRARRR